MRQMTMRAALAALAPALPVGASAAGGLQELHRSMGPENTTFSSLASGTTFRAGLLLPAPTSVLQTPPGEPLAAFLPIATRLLSTLRFPAA